MTVTARPATALRQGALGTWGVTALVVSAAAPLMVLAGVAPLTLGIAGPPAASAYLLAAGVLLVFAVGYTAMAARVPRNGAFHVYLAQAFGRRAGVTAAVLALVCYNAIQVGVWGLVGIQVSESVHDLTGSTPPWWAAALVGIVVVFLVAALGIDLGARLLLVLVSVELVLLAVLAVAVVAQAPDVSAAAFDPGQVVDSRVFAILGIGFGAFMGFEAAAVYRDEARDPDRTLRRATFAAIALMGALYAGVVWAVTHGFSDIADAAHAYGPRLFVVLADDVLSDSAGTSFSVLVVASALACQLAFHHTINRYTHGLAADGLLPRTLAGTHPRTDSPVRAGAAQAGLAFVVVSGFALAGADPFQHLLVWVNTPGVVGVMVLLVCVAAATFSYLRRRTDLDHRSAVLGCTVAATLLLAGAVVQLLRNVELLTGASIATNVVLIGIVPLTALVGWLWSGRTEASVGL